VRRWPETRHSAARDPRPRCIGTAGALATRRDRRRWPAARSYTRHLVGKRRVNARTPSGLCAVHPGAVDRPAAGRCQDGVSRRSRAWGL